MDKSNRKVRQKNGEIVVDALKNLSEPATMGDLVKYIADSQQLNASEIKEPIKEVLERGVEYGFLQKSGRRYSLEPSDEGDSEGEDLEENDGIEPEDRSRRRRKGRRSRSRSRKRSRSRSRRRRRR